MNSAPGYEIIKEMRMKKHISQKALGKKVGLTQQAIALMEKGKRKLEFSLFVDLLNAMDATPDELSKALSITFNGKRHIDRDFGSQSVEDLEDFFCYLESIGYKLSVENTFEMSSMHITPHGEDDLLIGISDDERDNVTFFHKKEFTEFQREIEKAIDYGIYKQIKKS